MNRLKDNMLLGMIVGIIVPVLSYFTLKFLLGIIVEENPLRESTMQVIALFVNFPIFRSILTKHKKDKLGRGMLLSTFVLAFWYIFHNNMLDF